MTDTLSAAVCLYGTDEPVARPHVLRAGRLSAELEGGNLRYIRYDGAEVLRAVSFIVRDKDWGTYNPVISDLAITQQDDRFSVSFSAVAGDAAQSFAYDARIEGYADGRLVFHGRGTGADGFLTNRTGFVVLHPIDGVAGAPVTITHTDDEIVEGRFPEIIDPVQPMMNLRALTHETPDGLRVTTLMQGDTFEMEDQRNWTDASYKTYVRPLALPWPYRIEPGEILDQTITITVAGQVANDHAGSAPVIAPGVALGSVPPLGLGLRPENVAETQRRAEAVQALAPAYLVLHHDPRAGHDGDSLKKQLEIARNIGAEPWLEAVIAAVDDAAASDEIAALGEISRALGDPFRTVLVSPAPDLKCTLPGSVWPAAPDAGQLYAAARAAFPDARIGGGMFSYFTELNRKPPPQGALDLVSFTTSPMVHAGDDRSVMETREAHPAIIASVTAIAKDTPWAVGPSAIGVRDNPYGEAAKPNPDNIRQAMNWNDPRQRGLLGAVWALGYFADFAQGGAAGIALGAPVGAFGAVSSRTDFPQPWYDTHQGLYPVFHVLRGLSRLRGQRMRELALRQSGDLTGLAVETVDGVELWLGNTGPELTRVTLGAGKTRLAVLDADSFEKAAHSAEFMDRLHDHDTSGLTLESFSIARIQIKQ